MDKVDFRRKATPGHWAFSAALEPAQQDAVKRLSLELKLSEVCARILVRRGMHGLEGADAFFRRRMDLLHDPQGLPDMSKAVARIAEAVDKNQKIVIFGDYDADGVTATALLARFFRVLKTRNRPMLEVDALVPERSQGYGLSAEAVEIIRHKKPALLITVDNGISAHESLARLAQAGIDCIVVDHHHVGETLPPAVAVINPKRKDSRYPFNELCGAGLAFKLAWALSVHFSQDRKVTPEFRAFLLDAMALAAIGTLADVVPLTGENRVLAHHGLKAMGGTAAPGLRALLDNCNLDDEATKIPRAVEVAFRVAPRINAPGRCGQAADALELLLTNDPVRAKALVKTLEGHNSERQKIEARILDEARQQALKMLAEMPGCRAFVLNADAWHIGVIGIVASRLVDEFHRPALLLSVDRASNVAQGSGRSIRGLHLCEALMREKEHLLSYGGHAAAAGLRIDAAKIDIFRASFQLTASSMLSDDDMLRRLHIDEQISLDQINQTLCAELDKFEPCGAGNARPMLAALGVSVPVLPGLMGKEEKHVSFFAKHQKSAMRVVGFNCAERFNALCDLSLKNGALDIAFRPKINTFRGNTNVELIMEAFRASEAHAG